MKKGIVTVFIIIGILVLGLIIWAILFNGGGVQNALSAVGDTVNGIWQGITGGNSKLINYSDDATNYNQLSDAKKAFGAPGT